MSGGGASEDAFLGPELPVVLLVVAVVVVVVVVVVAGAGWLLARRSTARRRPPLPPGRTAGPGTDRGAQSVARPVPGDGPARVLVVTAHADDLELACGGTVASLVRHGHRVRAVVLGAGPGGGDGGAVLRRDPATTGASVLGVRDVAIHPFPEGGLTDALPALTAVVAAAVDDLGPSTILTHSLHDRHPDHVAVHRAVLEAVGDGARVLGIESPSVSTDFVPGVLVDVGDVLDLKVTAIQSHRDRSGMPLVPASRIRALAAARGARAGVRAAEAFEVVAAGPRAVPTP